MSARMDRLEFYRETVEIADVDQDSVYIGVVPGDWRWTLVAAENGKTINASTESYRRRIEAVRCAARVARMLPGDLVQAVRRAAAGESVTLRSGRLRVVVTP